MNPLYTNERNHQILIALLKAHNIRQVIASPGTANSVFIGSIQNDSFFRLFSSVDERSAAYMACGLAYETREPVVISCTGATASRNYMPGLTEAYYSKLPILCITSSQPSCNIGHLISQVTDRSVTPKDIVKLSVTLPLINDSIEEWDCEVQVNKAITELWRHGGGPVHINLITTYAFNDRTALTCSELPKARKINRISVYDEYPSLPKGKIGIFVGSHQRWTSELIRQVDTFCSQHNAVVFCDHTSNYNGRHKIPFALAINQVPLIRTKHPAFQVELLVHIGEVSGEEGAVNMIRSKETWRVSEDGEMRDTFRNLSNVFEMREVDFFAHYAAQPGIGNTYLDECIGQYVSLYSSYLAHCSNLGDVPLSNVWVAATVAPRIPENASVVLGILNTLRTWNYAQFSPGVQVFSPVGGFGIDGATSCALGIALNSPFKLCFAVVGDLAFFYDLNSLGNRHVGNNLRILLINNGLGFEFKKTYAMAYNLLGEDVNPFVAANGHYSAKSPGLVKAYARALNFHYMSARSKEELIDTMEIFTADTPSEKPIILEVFVQASDERDALDIVQQRFK